MALIRRAGPLRLTLSIRYFATPEESSSTETALTALMNGVASPLDLANN